MAWPGFACWVALALPYVAAGLSKLRNGGSRWFAAENMRAILLTDSLNPMQFSFDLGLRLRHLPDAAFTGLALAAVALEIAFLAVLVSARARRALAVAMALTHVGILLMQNVFFPDLIALQALLLLGGNRRAEEPRPADPALRLVGPDGTGQPGRVPAAGLDPPDRGLSRHRDADVQPSSSSAGSGRVPQGAGDPGRRDAPSTPPSRRPSVPSPTADTAGCWQTWGRAAGRRRPVA